MFHIIVCIKQVPYPVTSASAYSIDNKSKRVMLPDDVLLVISPFDENAVEAALQLKEKVGGKVTVISLATNPASDGIRDFWGNLKPMESSNEFINRKT